MPFKPYAPSPHREEALEMLRNGADKEEILRRFPISESTYWRYARRVSDEQHGKARPEKVTEQPVVVGSTPASTTGEPQKPTGTAGGMQRGGELVTMVARRPSPVMFIADGNEIHVNTLHLLDAWRYCEAIKRIEPAIDDEFGLMLKIMAKYFWRYFKRRESGKSEVDLVSEKEGS